MVRMGLRGSYANQFTRECRQKLLRTVGLPLLTNGEQVLPVNSGCSLSSKPAKPTRSIVSAKVEEANLDAVLSVQARTSRSEVKWGRGEELSPQINIGDSQKTVWPPRVGMVIFSASWDPAVSEPKWLVSSLHFFLFQSASSLGLSKT